MEFIDGIILTCLIINLISSIYIYHDIDVLYKQIKEMRDVFSK